MEENDRFSLMAGTKQPVNGANLLVEIREWIDVQSDHGHRLFVHHDLNRIDLGSSPGRVEGTGEAAADGDSGSGQYPAGAEFKREAKLAADQISRGEGRQ